MPITRGMEKGRGKAARENTPVARPLFEKETVLARPPLSTNCKKHFRITDSHQISLKPRARSVVERERRLARGDGERV